MMYPRPSRYRLVGIILGLATYHNVSVLAQFPRLFFSRLLGQAATLDDVMRSDRRLGQSLRQV